MASDEIEVEILTAIGVDPHMVQKGSLEIQPIAGGGLITWRGQHFLPRDELSYILSSGSADGE